MATTPPSTQTALSRRTAEAEVRSLVSRLAPAHERLIGTLRRSLQERLPSAHELVYEYGDFLVISYSPNEHGYEGVLALRANADGVELWFNRGKELPDPGKLLRGSGKLTRSIHVEDASTFALPAVKSLIEEAIARNPVAFAPVGRGPLVIRPTTARKRRQPGP